ncbi:MAG: PorV/PorQ family protein [Elusimicrobiota bacterium]
MRNFLFLLICLTAYPLNRSFVWAKPAGTVSGQFLALGAGPRAVAMGEIGVAASQDAYAAYWNPAALVRLNSPEISLMHASHFESVDQQFAVYAQPMPFGTAALSFARLGVAPLPAYDVSGSPAGTLNAGDWGAGFSFGSSLFSGSLAMGVTAKWINERLGPVSASALAADLGALYRLPAIRAAPRLNHVRLGVAFVNAGQGLKFDTERFPLPQALRVGASLDDVVKSRPFTFSLEGVYPKDGSLYGALGGELWLTPMLALRGGWRGSQDIGSGLRLGFGVKAAGAIFDYAWSGFGNLGASHRIGITMRFGVPRHPLLQLIRGAPESAVPLPLESAVEPTAAAIFASAPPLPIPATAPDLPIASKILTPPVRSFLKIKARSAPSVIARPLSSPKGTKQSQKGNILDEIASGRKALAITNKKGGRFATTGAAFKKGILAGCLGAFFVALGVWFIYRRRSIGRG